MSIVKVNRSGHNHMICLTDAMNPNEQIGTLYNNEVFTWVNASPGNGWGYSVHGIAFRASDGTMKHGWISETNGVLDTNICSLAKFTKIVDGVTYYGFKLRRNEELYTSSGVPLSYQAQKDLHVLCRSSTGGSTMHNLLSVYYIETGVGTNLYKHIIYGNNAFIDIGYDKGSMFNSNASLIGNM